MRVGDRVILRADLYETLLDDFPDIVHSVDENGMIVFTNKKAETLLGYSRDELLSMSVHDINNPLAVVMMSLQMSGQQLERNGEPTPEALVAVRSLLEQAGHGAAVIQELAEQLLAFSRDVADEEARMDLKDVIDDSLFLSQIRIKKGSFLVDEAIPRGIHFTIGAPNQIQQVFVNLIGNAADAMSKTEDGTLRLSISPVTRGGADYWRCDVSDTGPGIPEDVVERVFESFFTTKGKGEGTGLGLSISRGIIKKHGGMIEIHSQPGVGTTLSVCTSNRRRTAAKAGVEFLEWALAHRPSPKISASGNVNANPYQRVKI